MRISELTIQSLKLNFDYPFRKIDISFKNSLEELRSFRSQFSLVTLTSGWFFNTRRVEPITSVWYPNLPKIEDLPFKFYLP